MPPHVHLLIEPLGTRRLSDLLKGIKGASARATNKILGSSGTFRLEESFDHIVRNESQYLRFQRYIAENPSKANLHPSHYWIYHAAIPKCGSSPSIPDWDPNRSTDKNVRATTLE